MIGAIVLTSGTGAATSNSSVPKTRWLSSEPPAPTITCAHIIITAVPSAAENRRRGLSFASRR